MIFLSFITSNSTGSMGNIKVFAVPGGILLLNVDPETQHYI